MDHLEHPRRRAGDTDKVLQLGNAVEKWFRLAWPIIIAIAGWYAHDIREPIKQIPRLERDLAAVQAQQAKAAVIDSISIVERGELRQGLLIIVRILCLREHADVRCQDILIPSSPGLPSITSPLRSDQ